MTTDIVQLKEKGKPVYLKTHTAAIDGLESYPTKADTDATYQKIAQKTPLWTGVLGLYANQSATPSKKITDCQTGWILVFQAYESGSASESTFHYFHIPKSHATYHNGAGINLQISDWRGVNRGLKYVYVRENRITGHEMNSISPNNKLVLTEIFEY
ncbi:hypothetical protein ACVV55_13770 [Enterococcus faecalis]